MGGVIIRDTSTHRGGIHRLKRVRAGRIHRVHIDVAIKRGARVLVQIGIRRLRQSSVVQSVRRVDENALLREEVNGTTILDSSPAIIAARTRQRADFQVRIRRRTAVGQIRLRLVQRHIRQSIGKSHQVRMEVLIGIRHLDRRRHRQIGSVQEARFQMSLSRRHELYGRCLQRHAISRREVVSRR